MRRTLHAAVNDILAACPERLRPDRYALIKALKLDRGNKRWPDAELAKILGGCPLGPGGKVLLTPEIKRQWAHTNEVLMDALIAADW